jgi:hypothetical protein
MHRTFVQPLKYAKGLMYTHAPHSSLVNSCLPTGITTTHKAAVHYIMHAISFFTGTAAAAGTSCVCKLGHNSVTGLTILQQRESEASEG